ncbi:MAG: hypothetical protein HZA01_01780 [Nitrospinae bacterium]|nr:hypothetical protein [Nitrospinota bacterium]
MSNGGKSRLELAFKTEGGGEAPETANEGTVTLRTERGSGSPAEVESLMEKVCERANLIHAYRKVKSNKGSPGVDGMGVDQLSGYLERHWPRIRVSLLEGSCKPKPGGGMRGTGRRLLERAVADGP